MTRTIFPSSAALLTTAMLASACATGPYRVHKKENTYTYVPLEKVTLQADDDYCKQICPSGKSSCQDAASSLEVFVDAQKSEMYRLAYVEFDDQGALWSPEQLEYGIQALQEIRDKRRGVILVAFVHGYNHNASVCDENVIEFRKVLRKVANTESRSATQEKRPARTVMGLYLGWRGRSAKRASFTPTSFNARKRGTQRMGSGDLLWVLDRFSRQIDKRYTPAPVGAAHRMITIGHSLGAAVLHGAVKTHIEREMLSKRTQVSPLFGDLVVYINPAFSAIEYDNIQNERARFLGTKTILLTLAAQGDFATGWAYRQSLKSMSGKGRYRDRDQKTRARETLGNYPQYYTHEFRPPNEDTSPASQSQLSRSEIKQVRAHAQKTREQRFLEETSFNDLLPPTDEDTTLHLKEGGVFPVNGSDRAVCEPFVVLFDKYGILMSDPKDRHNDIFNTSMQLFLLEYLAALGVVENCPQQPIYDKLSSQEKAQ